MADDTTQADRRIYFGGAIKAAGDGIVEGYLIKFTSPERADLYREWFDTDTDLHISEGYPIEGERALYHHGLDMKLGARVVGKLKNVRIDDAGVWAQAQLAMRDEYEEMIYALAQEGKLGWSTGALPQTVRVADNGHIDSWAVIEASLTPTPAMPFDTRISTLKALQSAIEPEASPREPQAIEDAPTQSHDGATSDERTPHNQAAKAELTEQVGVIDMDETQLRELILGILAELGVKAEVAPDVEEPMLEAMQAAATDLPAEATPEELMKAIVPAAVTAYYVAEEARKAKQSTTLKGIMGDLKKQPGVSKTAAVGLGGNSRVEVGVPNKYAHMSPKELALGFKLAVAMTPLGPRGLEGRSATDFVDEAYYKHAIAMAYRYHDGKPLAREQEEAPLKSARPFKANELDASNITGQGLEYLGYFYDSVVWETARNQRIYELMQSRGMLEKEVPQGNKTTTVPVEGADPTVYGGIEGNSTGADGRPETVYKITPIGTANAVVTPGTFRAATASTFTLGEESAVDMISEANRKLELALKENIEKAFINADSETAANTNINSIDGTPVSVGLTRDYYLEFDGLLKSPLVTSVAYKRDAGGLLSINDYLATQSLLPSAQAADVAGLFFVVDFFTRQASLKLPELKTKDTAGDQATIFTGTIPSLWDIPVYMSGFMGKANTAGKVQTATPGGNTTGRILLVYAPYWAFSYKRTLTIETERIPSSETTALYGSMRFSLTRRSASASAVTYNVGL